MLGQDFLRSYQFELNSVVPGLLLSPVYTTRVDGPS